MSREEHEGRLREIECLHTHSCKSAGEGLIGLLRHDHIAVIRRGFHNGPGSISINIG